MIQSRPGQSLFHLGPERDRSIFAGLNLRFAPLESADYVVCSGLVDDEKETPDDYRGRLQTMLKRKLFMVCGNPDIVVERGDRLVYCAGAIADIYAGMGGEVLYAGKPYRPIYDMALAKAETSSSAARRNCAGCWRSAIRCAPILPARMPSASIACSSPPGSTPRNWAAARHPAGARDQWPVRRPPANCRRR